MRVAIVTNSAWAAYNFRSNLAASICDLGHEVIFIIPFDGSYSDRLQQKYECYDLYLKANNQNPFEDIRTLMSLLKIFKIIRPDVIFNFTIKPNIYGSIAAKVFGIPSICNITGLGTLFITKRFTTKVAKVLYKFALSFSFLVFFQNKNDKLFFEKNSLVKKTTSQLLPGSGVDLKKFKPINLSIKHKKFVFLLVSRLLKEKGLYEFIEAIKIIRSDFPEMILEFRILGELGLQNRTAIQRNELDLWINEDLIVYLGMSDEVQNEIAQCDCIVLPSYREGMPRSILEAFAMEKPVIVSNVPGSVDIVENEVNGLICKVKSSSDLADKMIRMYSMPKEVRKEMGLSGRKKVEVFYDEKIVINRYIESINHIVKNEKAI